MSFDQTMATALNAGAKVNFNDDTYNLNFSYQDEDDGTLHQVFFPDAVTTFNIMRFGVYIHLAGFGLWRLGTEIAESGSIMARICVGERCSDANSKDNATQWDGRCELCWLW